MNEKSAQRRRNALVFGAIGGIIAIGVLFAPDPDADTGKARLTTRSREAWGAMGFYETAARLGWSVSRHDSASLPNPAARPVYALLAPQVSLTAAETHELLDAVREGAALFVVPGERSPLSDSLGIRLHGQYGRVPADTNAECRLTPRARAAEALRGSIWATAFEIRAPGSAAVRSFLEVERSDNRRGASVAAAGFELGRGRVGVIVDPDLLTNGVFRMCRLNAGVAAVQLLDYVSADERGARVRTHVVFDEYRHGYGTHPSLTRVTRRFITDNPVGRMLGHASVAGLLLLTAVGSRPSPPAPAARNLRRSPLEHVRALSLAYSQISATRTATRLLLRGLRRRLRLTGGEGLRAASDEDFLAFVEQRFPLLAGDVAVVARGLTTATRKQELVPVGRSILNIERTIASANS